MWLGGTDRATEGTWIWESSKEPIIYTNWDTHSAIKEFISKQPDNLGKLIQGSKTRYYDRNSGTIFFTAALFSVNYGVIVIFTLGQALSSL